MNLPNRGARPPRWVGTTRRDEPRSGELRGDELRGDEPRRDELRGPARVGKWNIPAQQSNGTPQVIARQDPESRPEMLSVPCAAGLVSRIAAEENIDVPRSRYEARSSQRIGRAAARTGLVTALSRIIGLGRILVISAVLGATYLGNTFQAANSVSNVLFELIAAGGLSAVLVPALVRGIANVVDTERLANGVLGVAALGLGFVVALGEWFAPTIGRILTSGAPLSVLADQRTLSTFLVRCFMPQILLYGLGTIATAVLHARRKFVVAAAAPIANTVVMVGCFVAFRLHAGRNPGLRLDTTSKWLLASAGTGSVVAFVLALAGYVWWDGMRLLPWFNFNNPDVRTLVRHAGWGILLNSIGGLLAAGLIVAGNAVEGGVVAFEVAFVLFMAPYAILARPLESASLPEFAEHASDADSGELVGAVRWTIESMSVLMAPVTVVLVVFARPMMLVLGFGLDHRGAALVAAALAGLAVGLVPYSAFLVMARAFYALDDSKTPAIVSLLCGVVGIVAIAISRVSLQSTALLGALGLAHSAAFGVGAIVLGRALTQRVKNSMLTPRAMVPVVVAVGLGVPMWIASRHFDQGTRLNLFVLCAVGGVAYLTVYVAVLRVGGYRLKRNRDAPVGL